MFSIFTRVMKPIRDTNSEPGLPVGKPVVSSHNAGCFPRLPSRFLSFASCRSSLLYKPAINWNNIIFAKGPSLVLKKLKMEIWRVQGQGWLELCFIAVLSSWACLGKNDRRTTVASQSKSYNHTVTVNARKSSRPYPGVNLHLDTETRSLKNFKTVYLKTGLSVKRSWLQSFVAGDITSGEMIFGWFWPSTNHIREFKHQRFILSDACQPEVSRFLFQHTLTLPNLYCQWSLLLRRRFAGELAQNLGLRVQKSHFRLTWCSKTQGRS